MVPQWAKAVVWYQIFPERFRNGDPDNDPTLASLSGSWPHDCTPPWQVHPWTAQWYKLQPYETQNGRDIWFNLQRRRYGGDLQGIIDKLDYLQDLGIGALYLNPVFESPSSHKYDAATYHHIDPHFGPDPDGDKLLMSAESPEDPATWQWTAADRLMLKVIHEVHVRGMKIIFDGVFNHMGLNSWAFQDILKNQQNSKFQDWFSIQSWNDPGSGTGFAYHGWFGVRELPELKQDENGIVKGPRDYIFAITRRWMDPDTDGNPDDGIDGWRLDVAFCINHPFWKEWSKWVKKINPDAYLTAEVIEPVEKLKPYLQGDEFDAVMNYNFGFACDEYFISQKHKLTTSEFDKTLHALCDAFDSDISLVQQNLLGSHDTDRIASRIINRNIGRFREWSHYHKISHADNPRYNSGKPGRQHYAVQKLIAVLQMTFVGAPMIYYGDECGMWGANDPDCRKPMLWDDLEYEDETINPDGSLKHAADTVEINEDLLQHYRKLIRIRNSHAALQLGDFGTILCDDEHDCYGFFRQYQDQRVIVVLNNSDHSQTVELNEDGRSFTDLLNDEFMCADEDGVLPVNVDGKWARILKVNR